MKTNSFTDEELFERKTFIGASEIGAVVKENPYKTPLDVYLDKTSDSIEQVYPGDVLRRMELGQILEEFVAYIYSVKTGNTVEIDKGVKRHPDYPHIATNIDRWVNNRRFLLECKTAGIWTKSMWGESGTDHIPTSYLCQVVQTATVCEALHKCEIPQVDVAVLFGDIATFESLALIKNWDEIDINYLLKTLDFRIYTCPRNPELSAQLLKMGDHFWHNHIAPRIPPEGCSAEDFAHLYPASNEDGVTADETIIAEVEELRALKAEKALLEKKIDQAQSAIKNFMKECSTLLDRMGRTLLTWKNSKSGSRIFNLKG
jgi:putative phage-type endonuclease